MNPTFDLLRSNLSSSASTSFRSYVQPLSRRGMLRRSSAVAIGVGAAMSLPSGSNRVEAALPFLIRATFTAAVGWIVEKALDHLYERYIASTPQVTESRVRPTNGRNAFHDAHAADLTIKPFRSDTTSCYSNRLSGRVDQAIYVVPSSHCSQKYGVWCHDLNYGEVVMLQKIYEHRCVTQIPLPTSVRQRPTDDDIIHISSALRKEKIDAEGLVLEYTREFHNLRGDQLTGFALSPEGDPEKRSLVFV